MKFKKTTEKVNASSNSMIAKLRILMPRKLGNDRGNCNHGIALAELSFCNSFFSPSVSDFLSSLDRMEELGEAE